MATIFELGETRAPARRERVGFWRRYREWMLAVLTVVVPVTGFAQAPRVPIYQQGRVQTDADAELNVAAKELFTKGTALRLTALTNQLKRESCRLSLPPPNPALMPPREICELARRAHVRVGWSYLCPKCDHWHLNLAGGYVITEDGVAATCYHVVHPAQEMKKGCLVAADTDGKVFPVTEILAANRSADVCLVRLAGKGFTPLSLNTNVFPGDTAYCYSDPADHRGFFSRNIVNRFYQASGEHENVSLDPDRRPTRLDVGTDWAPGSSGSAVLDECGNAIGHVSTIAAFTEGKARTESSATSKTGDTLIVFHEAVSARDVLRLVKRF